MSHSETTKNNIYGRWLKQVRTRKGLTQTQIAELLGYAGKQQISAIERGEKGISDQAARLIWVLDSGESDLTRYKKPDAKSLG